jgi:hypothetical protein
MAEEERSCDGPLAKSRLALLAVPLFGNEETVSDLAIIYSASRPALIAG